jgi:NitT/TauT family transport system substrate-binding protein
MDTHPEEAQQITSRRTGIDIATLQELWPNLTWMTGLDQTLLMTLEDEARWMISESGAAREVPDFLQFIDATALRQIRPWDVDIVEPLD